MLTESQQRYLQTIPEDRIAIVSPYNPKAAEYAKQLIGKIKESNPGLEVFWSGALALGISGINDIDLSLLSPEENFDKYLPNVIPILGEPTKQGDKNILWRTKKDGYHIDAYLSNRHSGDIQSHKKLFILLKNNPILLDECKSLKEAASGHPFREYQKRKYEFYNRILDLNK